MFLDRIQIISICIWYISSNIFIFRVRHAHVYTYNYLYIDQNISAERVGICSVFHGHGTKGSMGNGVFKHMFRFHWIILSFSSFDPLCDGSDEKIRQEKKLGLLWARDNGVAGNGVFKTCHCVMSDSRLRAGFESIRSGTVSVNSFWKYLISVYPFESRCSTSLRAQCRNEICLCLWKRFS